MIRHVRRNSAGDSCCYTWSDSLPPQLCGPHAQYDFTTSPLSLEIPLFRAALPASSLVLRFCGAALTERQVQELVSTLSPNERQLRRGVSQLEGLGQKVLSESCVY